MASDNPSRTIWQISAGPASRSYVGVFLKHGVALVGDVAGTRQGLARLMWAVRGSASAQRVEMSSRMESAWERVKRLSALPPDR